MILSGRLKVCFFGLAACVGNQQSFDAAEPGVIVEQ